MRRADLARSKSSLRNKLKSSLGLLSSAERRAKSKKIIRYLLNSPLFQRARNIVLYASLPGEVETRSLIRKALALKKNVFLPRINSTGTGLEVFQIQNPSRDLKRRHYGILEPRGTPSSKGRPQSMDLIIVPGLGFDRSGVRLGRGKGYFDRFLKKTIRAKKVGLAFKEQILRKIPAASQDVKVDKIITD